MAESRLHREHMGVEVPAERRRVCLISLHFAEYSLRLVQSLTSHVEMLVVVYHDNARNELGEDYPQQFAAAGVQLLVLPRPRRAMTVIANWRRLRQGVRAFAPQVLHLQEDLRDELVAALPWLGGVPLVLTVHDPQPHSGRDAQGFRFSRLRLYRWWVRRRADLVLTHGAYLVQLLEQDWPTLRGRVHGIAHGPLGPGGSPRRQLGAAGVKQLLFFGRIHAYKGLGAFVDMVKALQTAGLPVLGVVAGRGDDLELHRATMAAAGCFDVRDRYIPAAEVDALFAQAHAVVLPYTDGTQSGVAALALGYACPVVATQVGAIPELVRHGINGLLVPVGDAEALVAAASSLINDAGLHQRLADGARRLAGADLSWSAIAATTAAWYANVAAGRTTGLPK